MLMKNNGDDDDNDVDDDVDVDDFDDFNGLKILIMIMTNMKLKR